MTPSTQHHIEEFTVRAGQRLIIARLVTPERLSERPGLLLTFATDRETSLDVEPYCLAARVFLHQGHRALSIDLPNHGTRVDAYGAGITGLRNAFVDGQDRFAMFVEEAIAAIDWCVDYDVAVPGRIGTCGTSRGGYFALRLLATDPRVIAGAGFAPVTDWRDLSEFAADRERADVAALRLSCFADALAGKAVFFAIGNHDERVNTASCCRLYLDLLESNVRLGFGPQYVDFYCTDDAGHSMGNDWYRLGAEFLVNRIQG